MQKAGREAMMRGLQASKQKSPYIQGGHPPESLLLGFVYTKEPKR